MSHRNVTAKRRPVDSSKLPAMAKLGNFTHPTRYWRSANGYTKGVQKDQDPALHELLLSHLLCISVRPSRLQYGSPERKEILSVTLLEGFWGRQPAWGFWKYL